MNLTMLLAIDTATRWTGLALYDGRSVLAEVGWRAANTQTVELAPAVADLLQRVGLQAAELMGVAVALGPGSYTGLRIGLGLAKGLALANRLPLVGVPTLDILAASLPEMAGQLVAVAEAGRSRICAARYRWQSGKGWQAQGEPAIDNWENLLANLEGPAVFAGEISPVAAKMIRATDKAFRLVPAAAAVRRAGYLAELGWQRLRRGRTDDPAQLTPIYLRDPAGN
ncbi:MAG: tRNA (adenosine(37)-N6)-threonylcarbamoyltransferase complex dimerization subunit type 1 TsaB [Chloroflexi bacterium]|nr:tRNA (adenosine(37)-N6)-threonylcarbamoyltransferase complex dimerization subunit type 1 TsaB [Chloroflexota bacterium]MCI0581174.1 tRNA (adenosine(37)-N6)-threonylcarbamoyltransferase complex dimerization subunit type 1 TsaB [Chloroflexota bacterium]MCI0643457.1 tRNA (adenosine(37)-N6)-threonylcarbamoyltransferase complex dimerization subunit type 1 TsaB [Chloroflexota bacterium]MCI0727455.1 tRNA (adenosine(37)-N6)-threonylcarbamoyltransferase complex dimerization subunit type 1 TsaB [Chloro